VRCWSDSFQVGLVGAVNRCQFEPKNSPPAIDDRDAHPYEPERTEFQKQVVHLRGLSATQHYPDAWPSAPN